MIKTISATEARKRWFELLNLVYFKGEDYVIEKNNLPIVKLIPVKEPEVNNVEAVIAGTYGFIKDDNAYWSSEDEKVRKRELKRNSKLWKK